MSIFRHNTMSVSRARVRRKLRVTYSIFYEEDCQKARKTYTTCTGCRVIQNQSEFKKSLDKVVSTLLNRVGTELMAK